MRLTFLLILTAFSAVSLAQQNQGIGIGTTSPNASAKLEVSSTNSGLLIPRMSSAQRAAIASPALGLMVFDTDRSTIMFFDGSNWLAMAFANESKVTPVSRNTSAPSTYAQFGSRVAISGNYAIIAAPRETVGQFQGVGAAYVFSKESGSWKEVKRLTAWDGLANDYFGSAIAISGDYIAVGSCNKKVGNNNSQGKVYMYRRNGTDWITDSAITKVNGLAYDYLGWSLALSATASGGPKLIIGNPYADVGGADRGEVLCYTRGTNGWSYFQNIVPTDLGASDNFGTCIAMYGDYAVVGAPLQDNLTYAYADAGAAYVYVFGGGVWNFQSKFQGTTARSNFGMALAIYEDRIAVGAPWAIAYNNTSSAVYLYRRTGATWNSNSYLFIYNFEIVPGASQISSNSSTTNKSISIANLTFGMSLALDGPNLLVGAPAGLDYPNGGSSYYSDNPGSVYFYKNLSGDTYTRMQIIRSDFPTGADLYGQSIAISGDKYIIANSHATVNNMLYAGTVYFGSLPN